MYPSTITSPTRVSDAIVSVLAEAEIEFVFGMPGGDTGRLFRALHEHPSIKIIQVREESIGSTMAEAYGRMTGRPAVVMGQGEWIAGNAGQGILEAMLGSSPMVILTEMSDGGALSHHGHYQAGSGDYGAWDVRTALSGITKRVMVSHSPAQAVQHTQLGIKHALTGNPGPVAVVFRSDSLRGTIGPSSVPRIYPTGAYLPRRSKAFDGDAVDSAATSLMAAERPVIIAGNGIRVAQACSNLDSLARAFDIPVATTASGKGVFPETDQLAAGVIGTFGISIANTMLAEADVVLVVGSRLGTMDTIDEHPGLLNPPTQTIIQIDVEPLNVGWTYPVDLQLIGDAGHIMDRLSVACELKASPSNRSKEGVARVSAVASKGEKRPEPISDEMPLAPQRIIQEIQACLPPDSVVTCDAGENRLFMMHWYRAKSANSYLQPASGGGMGYAVPAAMGARLANPKRPVLAVCGDGGFAMSIHGLMTAVSAAIPITVLVFNNNALGWVLHGMGDATEVARLGEFDHAGIARSLGCEGIRVNNVDDLHNALMGVGQRISPCVIDVPTSLSPTFKDITQSMV